MEKAGDYFRRNQRFAEAYEDMLKAILWMLDGARYLWQGEEKALTAATVRAVITGKPLLSTITIQV